MGFELVVPVDQIKGFSVIGSNLHKWIKHFDVNYYKNFEHVSGKADLKHLSDDEARLHFINNGYNEGRAYNSFFMSFIEPNFYLKKYPELVLKTKGEVIRHWMYHGVYEKRIPNKFTEQMLDANIHLFQVGKVGSKSIEKALKAAGHDKLIPHLHWPNEQIISYRNCFYSYEEVINFDPNKKILFISGVRDPIDRVISGNFQSVNDPKSNSNEYDALFKFYKQPMNVLGPKFKLNLEPVLSWFDHNYFSDINVYDYPFDPDQGYSIIRKNNVTVFIYRLDALDRCWSALSELTGLSLKPIIENASSNKVYSEMLTEVYGRKDLRVEFHDMIQNSNYWKHFFAESSY